jgi:hypothetical protein
MTSSHGCASGDEGDFRMAMQTTGTFPQLTTKQPKPKGKGGGKKW